MENDDNEAHEAGLYDDRDDEVEADIRQQELDDERRESDYELNK